MVISAKIAILRNDSINQIISTLFDTEPIAMYTRIFLLGICLLGSILGHTQHISTSRTTSYYTYLYQIQSSEAKSLYESGLKAVNESFLHTLIDSFPTDSGHYHKQLPVGQYLFAHIRKDQLMITLESVNPVEIKLLNNHQDLSLIIHDSIGTQIPNAEVFVQQKRIPYDASSQSYRLRKKHKAGLLSVHHKGYTSYFRINQSHPNRGNFKRISLRIAYSFPIKHLYRPLRATVLSIKENRAYGWVRWLNSRFSYRKDWMNWRARKKGFLITNKPMYRPGDTLCFKAYITNRRGRPLTRPLQFLLENKYGGQIYFQKRISPDPKGSYLSDIVLHDSLGMKLDAKYSIQLVRKSGKTVLNRDFRLEEYELDQTQYVFRAPQAEHSPGVPLAVFVRGSDANDLNVLDARIHLSVHPKHLYAFQADSLFLADTLWTFQQQLDPIGETKILIPDSIFPNSRLDYEVRAVFTNAANERHEETLDIKFLPITHKLTLELAADSLVADYLSKGKSVSKPATLYALTETNDTLATYSLTLPASLPINPLVPEYNLRVDSLSIFLKLSQENSMLACNAFRSADSLYITIQNPRNLEFWYHIYRKNAPLKRGRTRELDLIMPATKRQNYYISIQYIWRGIVEEAEYEVLFQNKQLTVQLEHPDIIYPGQKVEVGLSVKDQSGNPVPNADLLAYGVNSQFTPKNLPSVPEFSKWYRKRIAYNSFSKAPEMLTNRRQQLKLDYPKWSQQMGLDSIAWFAFLYPKAGIATFQIPSRDSLTQFAPYVVQQGKLLDVHLIYLDETLIYYRGVAVENRYSFAASPGYHTLSLRTTDYIIQIDSLWIPEGVKSIISLDAIPFNSNATVSYEGPKLSWQEKRVLNRTLMPIKNENRDQIWLQQQDRIQTIHTDWNYATSNQPKLAGPFNQNLFSFSTSIDPQKRSASFEPGFSYEFLSEVVKMKPFSVYDYLPKHLSEQHGSPNFRDYVFTSNELDSIQQSLVEEEKNPFVHIRHDTEATSVSGLGDLVLWPPPLDSVVALILVQTNDSGLVKIYPPNHRSFYQLQPGTYDLIALKLDSSYFHFRDLHTQANGQFHYRIQSQSPVPPNAFSLSLFDLLSKKIYDSNGIEIQKNILRNLYQSSKQSSLFQASSSGISGSVFDVDGNPLGFATVLVLEGDRVRYGTQTDQHGFFGIKPVDPGNYEIVASFTGDKSNKMPIFVVANRLRHIDLYFSQEVGVSTLDEVMIASYANPTMKKNLGYEIVNMGTRNITTIVASSVGVYQPDGIQVRGARAVPTVYYIDGVKVRGTPNLPQSSIARIEVLEGDTPESLDSHTPGNQTIMITTHAFLNRRLATLSEDVLQAGGIGNSLRSNFRDDAFWQPNLMTDKQGRASFTVTFPDDITRWNTYALAMGPRKQSGQTESSIKSYKELMAQLALPRFMVQGDSAFAIGKVLNYSPDTLDVTTEFQLNELPSQTRTTSVVTAIFDTLVVRAPEEDSLTLTYSMQQPNGYFDGEKRSIPLFPQGGLETTGQFLNLEGDTTAVILFDSTASQIKLYAQAHPIKVLLGEFRQMRDYRYLCNEQAASKLKALLMEKQVREFLGDTINIDRSVKRLIKKLQDTQDEEGLWGWWANGQYNPWISRQVIESLLQAQEVGYSASFNRRAASDQLIYQLERSSSSPSHKIHSLMLLRQLNSKPDFLAYLNNLNADTTLGLTEQLQIIELRQQLDLPYSLDSLEKHQQETLFGNLYWGKSGYHPYRNTYTPTLSAYRILQTKGGEEQRLQKIRNYFFEQKKSGYWPNTYASASVLETILPDLISDSTEITPPKLTLSGAVNTSITEFPYEANISPKQALSVSKTGTSPVYFTTFQQKWNPEPKAVSGDFSVESFFLANRDTLRHLEAAQPTILRVSVRVEKNADFMMLEIPIPAGCSYGKKIQSYFRQPEVHREYFKDHVSIFCERMPEGVYQFDVELLPRYSGSFTVNPARIEQMYFPICFGRNESKRIRVE